MRPWCIQCQMGKCCYRPQQKEKLLMNLLCDMRKRNEMKEEMEEEQGIGW